MGCLQIRSTEKSLDRVAGCQQDVNYELELPKKKPYSPIQIGCPVLLPSEDT